MQRLLLVGAVLLGLAVAGCGDGGGEANQTTAGPEKQDFGAFENREGLSTAAALVERAELDSVLEGPGSYTLFAPTDQAFAAIPEEQRKVLESDEGRPQLIALVRQHMAPGYFAAEDIANAVRSGNGLVRLASLGTAPIPVRDQNGALTVGDSTAFGRVVGDPIRVNNSLIYPIDRVLPPPPEEQPGD